MSRTVVAAAMVGLLAAAPAGAEVFILDMSPNSFSIQEPAAMGETLEIVGVLTQVQVNPPFALPGIIDWSTEYTLYFYGLTLNSPPGNMVREFTGGTVELWSEAPPDAPWGPTTPDASIPAFDSNVVPSSFANGTLLLRGDFQEFVILDFTQIGGNTGVITASDIDFVGGSKLPDLQAMGIENDWAWNGDFNVTKPVPPGYLRAYSGKIERVPEPTSVEASTWGHIKAQFQADGN